MSIDFHFDEATHIYRFAANGQIIPGHTRVLDMGGLVPYADIEPDILERKSAIGREAHLACLMSDQEKRFTFDPRVQGYLEAWRDFRAMSGYNPILCEYRDVYQLDGFWFGMQIDRIGRFPKTSRFTVVELKTVTTVMPHHGVQLAAQAACVQIPGHRSYSAYASFLMRDRLVVQLFDDGKWKIHRFEDRGDFDQFRRSLGTTYWKMQHERFYREVNREQLIATDAVF